MPHYDENQRSFPSQDILQEDDTLLFRKYQFLQEAHVGLGAKYEHAEEQRRNNRTALEKAQEEIKQLETALPEIQKACEAMREGNEKLRSMNTNLSNEVAELSIHIHDLKEAKEMGSENEDGNGGEGLREELKSCKEELERLRSVSEVEKSQIEELSSTVAIRNKTIDLLAKKANFLADKVGVMGKKGREYKDDLEGAAKDSDDRADRAERAEESLNKAHWLQQNKALDAVQLEVLADELENIALGMDEVNEAKEEVVGTLMEQFSKLVDENEELKR
jgi:chromosome segregation ATPase